jgi:hypothetical protein
MVVAFSCTPPPDPPEPKLEDNWTYLYTNYDSLGNVVDTTTFHFQATELGSWVNLHNIENPTMTTLPSGCFRMKNDGLHTLVSNISLSYDALFLKKPGAAGEIYQFNYYPGYDGDIIISSTSDSVTVPFGFFTSLYRYDYYFPAKGANIWFNDSVWFVKYNCLDSLESGLGTYVDYSYELVDYEMH